MAECRHYGGITRDEVERLRDDLAAAGLAAPPGDDVIIDAPSYRVKLRALYDESRQTLTVCIESCPFYIPPAMIWEVVETAVLPYTAN